MPGHDIIVVGASAGGVEALLAITSDLPSDLPAAIFVVLHLPARAPTALHRILSRTSRLPVTVARHNASIELGHIYVAQNDHHLVLTPHAMQLIHGPKE